MNCILECGIIKDLAILLLQLSGALLVARLAVRWALRRYKSEKTWERRVSAYAEAIESLAAMKKILGVWEDQALCHSTPSDEYERDLNSAFSASKRQLEKVTAVAKLLLKKNASDILVDLEMAMRAENHDNFFEHIQAQWGLVDKALSALIDQGQKDLRAHL